MLSIRKSIFETNSSSSDYYYDDYDDYPITDEFLIGLDVKIEFVNPKYNKYLDTYEFKELFEEYLYTILEDFDFIRDTYIDNREIKNCYSVEYCDVGVCFWVELLNYSESWIESKAIHCPATRYEPDQSKPTIFGQKLPEWNDKYTKELESLLKTSKYGEYIERIEIIKVNVGFLQNELSYIVDNGLSVIFQTPTNKNFDLFNYFN